MKAFEVNFCKLVFEMPVVSPVSPILANLLTKCMENKAVTEFPHDLLKTYYIATKNQVAS